MKFTLEIERDAPLTFAEKVLGAIALASPIIGSKLVEVLVCR